MYHEDGSFCDITRLKAVPVHCCINPKLVLAGAAATENCVGDLEGVINEMNAATPDVIISIIPSPGQEHFLVEHRDKINANLWYGIGGFEVHRKRSRIKGFFWNLIHRVRLKNSIEKYES